MKIYRISSGKTRFDFESAIRHASVVAFQFLGDNMLVSWYDRDRDIESPSHASECHEGCAAKGYWDYALSRGGTLAVDFDDSRFVFCFRPLEDSALSQ